ncbi:uncharacterized protein LOC142331713 [Lycorma delicatula]|uniref:uncharacterized protein LOC142331713 n=1 Tax=Lycorma delicatula TaxID=130591 RepID=UPI003F5120D2
MCRIKIKTCRINVLQGTFVLGLILQSTLTALAIQVEQTTQSTKIEDRKSEDRIGDNIAQSSSSSSSFSTVVYHDPPKQRYIKSPQDEANPAQSAESSTTFRLYHPKLETYLGNINPALVQNLMKQQPQTFDLSKTKVDQQTSNNQFQQLHHQHNQFQLHQLHNNHNYNTKEEPKAEETVTKYLYPPKKYKSVEPGTQTVFNVGYSIGFGGPSNSDKTQGSRLNSATIDNEEVVTGKPKQSFRIRVEGKNSYWKQLSPGVEMSQNLPDNQLVTTSPTTPRSHFQSLLDLPTEGRNTFDHNHALTQSNPFDVTNAVDPYFSTQPLALPLTFPLPLHETILLPQPAPQTLPETTLPQSLQSYSNEIRAAPTTHRESRKQPKFLDTKATGTGNFQAVDTALLPQDNFFPTINNNIYSSQTDNLLLPSMQQVLISLGKDGQMVPAYLIPVAAMNQYPLPQSFFPQNYLPQSQSSNSGIQFQEPTTSSTIGEPQVDQKPFKPSPLLNIESPTSQQTRQIQSDILKQQFQTVPKSLITLRPPAPEKQQQQSTSSASYQLYEQDNRPKVKTILQIRPAQIPVQLRPSRDLASEQSMLNAILSQELYRKNASPGRVSLPVIPQTIYGAFLMVVAVGASMPTEPKKRGVVGAGLGGWPGAGAGLGLGLGPWASPSAGWPLGSAGGIPDYSSAGFGIVDSLTPSHYTSAVLPSDLGVSKGHLSSVAAANAAEVGAALAQAKEASAAAAIAQHRVQAAKEAVLVQQRIAAAKEAAAAAAIQRSEAAAATAAAIQRSEAAHAAIQRHEAAAAAASALQRSEAAAAAAAAIQRSQAAAAAIQKTAAKAAAAAASVQHAAQSAQHAPVHSSAPWG